MTSAELSRSLTHWITALPAATSRADPFPSFVGSLNLDPRSIDLDTEMGVMIDSEDLTNMLAERSLQRIPEMAYKLELDDKNKITWHATIDGQQVVETKEPLTTVWRRFLAWLLKIMPEKQL